MDILLLEDRVRNIENPSMISRLRFKIKLELLQMGDGIDVTDENL